MQNSRMPRKEEIYSALAEYDRAIKDQDIPESEVDRALLRLDRIAPHSYITDLIHSGEKERSDEEAVEEALIRERIWHDGGDFALYCHMESQFIQALQDSSITVRRRRYCEKMIKHIQEIMDRSTH